MCTPLPPGRVTAEMLAQLERRHRCLEPRNLGRAGAVDGRCLRPREAVDGHAVELVGEADLDARLVVCAQPSGCVKA